MKLLLVSRITLAFANVSFILLLLFQNVRSVTKQVTLKDAREALSDGQLAGYTDRQDIHIKMISHEIHGGNQHNQLLLDVSSSKLAHHKWHENYRIQITNNVHTLCDSPMTTLVNDKFQCMLDNHMLVPGDNAFSIIIYNEDDQQIYFEKETHFYFAGTPMDLHQTSNSIWHWHEMIDSHPKRLLVAVGVVSLGSFVFSIPKSTALKKIEDPGTLQFPPVAPYSKPSLPKPPRTFPKKKKPYFRVFRSSPGVMVTTHDTEAEIDVSVDPKIIEGIEPSKITEKFGTALLKGAAIVAIGLGVSLSRVVIVKGLGAIFSLVPLFAKSFNASKRLSNEDKPRKIDPIPSGPVSPQTIMKTDKLFHFVTLPDGTKIFKSSINWLESIGNTLLLTNTGHPYFLKQTRRHLFEGVLPTDDTLEKSSS